MRLNGWLLYNKEDAKKNHSFISWFIDEAKTLNIELNLIYKEELLYGVKNHQLYIEHPTKMALPRFVIMRHIDPLLTKQFEFLGVTCFNTSFVADCCNHKAKTHQLLAMAKIPMIDTVFTKRNEWSEDRCLPFTYPVVVKQVEGRGGQQVYSVSSPEQLKQLMTHLRSNDLIIQKMGAIPGKDIRVFVIGESIIAATLRTSNSSFKANVSLGGSSQLYKLSLKEEALVHKIISQFNGELGFVGIDFIFDSDGSLLFNEIEDVVGSRTLSANTSINVVKLYLEFILNKI